MDRIDDDTDTPGFEYGLNAIGDLSCQFFLDLQASSENIKTTNAPTKSSPVIVASAKVRFRISQPSPTVPNIP